MAGVACTSGDAAPASKGEGGAPYSLDSALTVFRVGLDSVSELEHGAASIDELIARLRSAVERSDTVALRQLVMSRREFAWAYYPTSRYTRAPMKQEPGLVWFLHLQNSQKGASRLLERHGGKPLRLAGNECKGPARVEGANVVWDDCVQRLIEGGDTSIVRLVGGIVERHGRFKFFSYSNDL